MATIVPVKEQFFLFGNCNIVPDRYDDWQAAYDKLADHVMAHEPNTLTYYFGIPLEHQSNPSRTDNMLAFEAYRSRSDLYDVHLKSDVMTTAFLPSAGPAMTTGLDLTHFAAVGGFLDLSGEKTECGLMHDVQIQCVDGAARERVLDVLRALCEEVEERQQDGRGHVLTFLGLRSLDNETGARIFARYKSREVWEAWLRGELIQGFWGSVKPCVASMEAKAYAPNGKGWLWK
ncbi:hypothetical protein FZEAL_1033 [Fusarium zealandicum]|uniref:ABM domain-containing protein n=1 Tax=Fusarium zealandicum TaxID=1053134 RepID=A0A8H4UTK6_9HYPO|nr:hypothetical protein FZEAL_1033 [Fusarium zealandicum]